MSALSNSQWLFPLNSLEATPSICSLEKELYDRARGVEFLFRLGSSLQLPTSALCTAATWLHRFYMRYPMEEFHRQDVAAACIFLATKTEECGRKLVDVARIYQTKVLNLSEPKQIPEDSQEVNERSAAILQTEEVLLEALCFDFFVESPHAELVDLFDSCESPPPVQEFAWSLAHDSYRTPLSILYPPRIIATACYVLAQRVFDGPNSPSLDARISATSPSSHLPTPPSHKPPSPDATRVVVERYAFNEVELAGIADALHILLEFYSSQDENTFPYLSNIASVPAPAKTTTRPRFYAPANQINPLPPQPANHGHTSPEDSLGRTPSSIHGGRSPDPTPQNPQP
ncbi:cyclin-like protein [Coprinellus micaceus]|uniref:Cyclin-like protein n=1 Tax=Coprinellus micaceus TaxID=71717 RepID=A0A4Y7TQR9_COPMI|nr:cyclin-like protein [Coprinellus micaceus]